ncbi:DUF5107 domain-containing protein [Actinomyces glycerinitolerans]|uniref:DUF5107 domain-containing protein n=1 Tax=Actinomyces glycerinitolerans TaxID=1892869 RepID=A0A1M4S0C9_9ACTO|nr:DUF5107 domain-containing protein [Actinomyces glycerinitolerans]SHE25684.1 Hypothetical protein ACGLYG10_1914 [Actinomyces glycerinitolerans]
MSDIRFETTVIPVTSLGELGELILDGGDRRVPTAADLELLQVGEHHASGPPTLLPYRYQDSYDGSVTPSELNVAILENQRLRAEFLLDLGGRLWRLTDRRSGRELLHQPERIDLANLALRNAWFAGGVEWNLGTTGHWGLTNEPVAAGTLPDGRGGRILRMWAYERMLGLTWRLDAWLPDGSDSLYTHILLENPTTREVPVYWWSNIAIPQSASTRVIVDADSAFHFGYADALDIVSVPEYHGRDITHPQRQAGGADYFYRIRSRIPWIAAVDGDGVGICQYSTHELSGRKLFTWGSGMGGRSWQRRLSGTRRYAEIQAGLAPTQLEHLHLSAGASIRFTECYGPVAIDNPEDQWEAVVARTARAVINPARLEEASARLTSLEQSRVTPVPLKDGPEERAAREGWGALEVLAGHRVASWATPFNTDTLNAEQSAWLKAARTGQLDPILLGSAMIGPDWIAVLRRAMPSWLRDYLLGVALHAAGFTQEARALWRKSERAHLTADVLRALALTDSDGEARARGLLRAHTLAPNRHGITIEALTHLLDIGLIDKALTLIDSLPSAVRGLPRVQYLECVGRVRAGHLARARELIETPLSLPDLREGDLGLERLWWDYQHLAGTHDPVPEAYAFAMTTPTQEERY